VNEHRNDAGYLVSLDVGVVDGDSHTTYYRDQSTCQSTYLAEVKHDCENPQEASSQMNLLMCSQVVSVDPNSYR
jgi:hypothetical protein